MNKNAVKNTMLNLEEAQLAHAREHYREYLESARLDRTEPVDRDEQAQAETAGDAAKAFDQPVHTHADKIAKLKMIDFGPKTEVEEGAIVKVDGRHFVIAVATARFECEGNCLMGISTQAPIFKAMEGKGAGETCSVNGRSFNIEEVL